jgi:hypothetical protein
MYTGPICRGLREGSLDRLRHTAPIKQFDVLHDDPGTDHHKHSRINIGPLERPEQNIFDHRSDDTSGNDRSHQRREKIHPPRHLEQERRVRSERIELTMCEVHNLHDTEDESQPYSQQGVSAAQSQHVYQMLQKLVHETPIPAKPAPVSAKPKRSTR